jgi:hypothetical protein
MFVLATRQDAQTPDAWRPIAYRVLEYFEKGEVGAV